MIRRRLPYGILQRWMLDCCEKDRRRRHRRAAGWQVWSQYHSCRYVMIWEPTTHWPWG